VPRIAVAIVACLAALAMPAAAAAQPSFGVHTPGVPFANDVGGIDGLQTALGRRISVVSWFQNWGGGWISSVHPRMIDATTRSGRRPLITWEPWRGGEGAWQPDFRLARIAGGAYDGYIARWARALRRERGVVYLRPMHEMNGNWYPWGGTVNGNSPRLFRAAWRRIHRIFLREGARNVRWVWCPINEDWPLVAGNRMERYYPGRRYVDVLAVDGYNWGTGRPSFGGWRSFRATFSGAYRRLSRLGPQPIWIAETGSTSDGGSKAAWARDMFREAARMPRLRTIVWMDTVADGEDWRLLSPASTAGAFQA
jgi:hypothetical protein